MLNTVLVTLSIIGGVFLIIAMCCAMIVAGRSDEEESTENIKGADDILEKTNMSKTQGRQAKQ